MLTRQGLIERAKGYGYQVMETGHGQDIYIRVDDTWEVIADTLEEVPLLFIGHPHLSKELEEFSNTPIHYRQIIYPYTTFRVKDAMSELLTIGYEPELDEQGILTIYHKGWKVLDMDTHRPMVTHFHIAAHMQEDEYYIEFLGIIYELMQTTPEIRYWTYTYDEQILLSSYPNARYLTRDKYTGGITLHKYKPFNYQGIFESEGAITLPYNSSLFLYVNYSNRPYKI